MRRVLIRHRPFQGALGADLDLSANSDRTLDAAPLSSGAFVMSQWLAHTDIHDFWRWPTPLRLVAGGLYTA